MDGHASGSRTDSKELKEIERRRQIWELFGKKNQQGLVQQRWGRGSSGLSENHIYSEETHKKQVSRGGETESWVLPIPSLRFSWNRSKILSKQVATECTPRGREEGRTWEGIGIWVVVKKEGVMSWHEKNAKRVQQVRNETSRTVNI